MTTWLASSPALMTWHKLKLKATFESNSAHLSLKRLVPGAYNVSLIASTCTASP